MNYKVFYLATQHVMLYKNNNIVYVCEYIVPIEY